MEIKEIRNPSYTADGLIDLEIKHPDYGWLPYTLDMSDKDTTIDNESLKSMVDTMKIAEYVEPDIPPQNEEVKDIIGSLWEK